MAIVKARVAPDNDIGGPAYVDLSTADVDVVGQCLKVSGADGNTTLIPFRCWRELVEEVETHFYPDYIPE